MLFGAAASRSFTHLVVACSSMPRSSHKASEQSQWPKHLLCTPSHCAPAFPPGLEHLYLKVSEQPQWPKHLLCTPGHCAPAPPPGLAHLLVLLARSHTCTPGLCRLPVPLYTCSLACNPGSCMLIHWLAPLDSAHVFCADRPRRRPAPGQVP